ncbi:MAG: hypothetical protein ACRD50_07995 [Candidatus Acidiferrales bacterium]
MNSVVARASRIASLASLALLVSGDARAQAYTAQTESLAPPSQLAAPVRDALSAQAIRVSSPQGELCEIWLRKSIPVNATPDQGLGILYGQLSVGELLGAIQFPSEVIDYRNQHIKPGVYTLRYGLQPVDGNHQGVSDYRDFLLLAPAAEDTQPAGVAEKDLFDLSRQATGSKHPSVWSLVASDGAPDSLPGTTHHEDSDTWVLYFRLPIGAAGAPVTMALIVSGHAPESGT